MHCFRLNSGLKTDWLLNRATKPSGIVPLFMPYGVFLLPVIQNGDFNICSIIRTAGLLGEHVPYPVEAYPEGDQRHLSAESGLYCRIFTEGLFGIRPTGLNSFTVTPQLPDGWDFMRLKNVHGFGKEYNIEVKRESGQIRLTVTAGGVIAFNKVIKAASTQIIKLP